MPSQGNAGLLACSVFDFTVCLFVCLFVCLLVEVRFLFVRVSICCFCRGCCFWSCFLLLSDCLYCFSLLVFMFCALLLCCFSLCVALLCFFLCCCALYFAKVLLVMLRAYAYRWLSERGVWRSGKSKTKVVKRRFWNTSSSTQFQSRNSYAEVPLGTLSHVLFGLKALSHLLFCLKAVSHVLFGLEALLHVLFESDYFLTHCLN